MSKSHQSLGNYYLYYSQNPPFINNKMKNNKMNVNIRDYVHINSYSFKFFMKCNISHITVQNIRHNDREYTIPCTQARPTMWLVPLRNSNTPIYKPPNIPLTRRKRHTCRGVHTKTIFTWLLCRALWLIRIALLPR